MVVYIYIKEGIQIDSSHQQHISRFTNQFFWEERREKKTTFLSRYPKVTDLATLETINKRKKEKNTARKKTMAWDKYIPDRPIVDFTTSKKPLEEVSLTKL